MRFAIAVLKQLLKWRKHKTSVLSIVHATSHPKSGRTDQMGVRGKRGEQRARTQSINPYIHPLREKLATPLASLDSLVNLTTYMNVRRT